MSYTIKVDNLNNVVRAFKKSPIVVDGELQGGVKEAGKLVLRTEKKEAPVGTGNLRRGITFNYKPISALIYPTPNYAVYVHGGTGIYGPRKSLIRPKTAKVLAFKKGGRMIFAKSVKGQRANPFVERTVKKAQRGVNSIFDKVLNNIIQKI